MSIDKRKLDSRMPSILANSYHRFVVIVVAGAAILVICIPSS